MGVDPSRQTRADRLLNFSLLTVLAPAVVLSVAAILVFEPNVGWLAAIWQILAIGVIVLALARLVVRAARARQRMSRARHGRRLSVGIVFLVYAEFLLALIVPGVAWLWTGSIERAFIAEGGYVLLGFLAITIVTIVAGIRGGLRLAFDREHTDHRQPDKNTP